MVNNKVFFAPSPHLHPHISYTKRGTSRRIQRALHFGSGGEGARGLLDFDKVKLY